MMRFYVLIRQFKSIQNELKHGITKVRFSKHTVAQPKQMRLIQRLKT